MKKILPVFASALLCACSVPEAGDVVIDNSAFTLVIGGDACAKSLKIKGSGEQMLPKRARTPLFSVTQKRPFNNEVKLENPLTRTTYEANRLRRNGDTLFVGFETAPYEAVIIMKEGRGYVTFTLDDFICDSEHVYRGLSMDFPCLESMRLLQLPVKEKENFGRWLNVMWDRRGAVCVGACDPYSLIWHEDRGYGRILTADLFPAKKLRGGSAAIVAGSSKEDFLDSMQGFEVDLGLPHGVKSRRSPLLNRSIYWTSEATPENIDKVIETAKKAGLEMMLFYYRCFFNEESHYSYLGDYDFLDTYPGGLDDIRAMIEKVKAAGIHPGLHVLQTHIGTKSRYVTPVLDPRLGKVRHLTLKSEIPATGDVKEITVEENPAESPLHDNCRVLAFGGEAFSYEGYTSEAPYRFFGVRRGHYGTQASKHPKGEIGGILDISEFCAESIYLDQDTDLQDEIAGKIAQVYNCGFEFAYFDGAEGVGSPCGINVALSQYRVISKFDSMPIFTEGAAKSHFGWHFQAGANAFDVFKPDVFKEMIMEHPYAEARLMKKDMTRVDFGWWRIFPDTTPEMWDFADGKAAECDCPVAIQMFLEEIENHPQGEELLAVLKKWEDYRRNN